MMQGKISSNFAMIQTDWQLAESFVLYRSVYVVRGFELAELLFNRNLPA
jgi:hypothetical protein